MPCRCYCTKYGVKKLCGPCSNAKLSKTLWLIYMDSFVHNYFSVYFIFHHCKFFLYVTPYMKQKIYFRKTKQKNATWKKWLKLGWNPNLSYIINHFWRHLLFKLKLGILPRVHITLKLSLVCCTDLLFFPRPLNKQVKMKPQGINWALAQALVFVFIHS